MMSPELKSALKDWLDWVERGAPEGEPYSRRYGLCSNLDRFDDVSDELSEVFRLQDLDDTIPFGCDYDIRSLSRTQHECPKRLAWVRKQLEE